LDLCNFLVIKKIIILNIRNIYRLFILVFYRRNFNVLNFVHFMSMWNYKIKVKKKKITSIWMKNVEYLFLCFIFYSFNRILLNSNMRLKNCWEVNWLIKFINDDITSESSFMFFDWPCNYYLETSINFYFLHSLQGNVITLQMWYNLIRIM